MQVFDFESDRNIAENIRSKIDSFHYNRKIFWNLVQLKVDLEQQQNIK